MKKIPITPGDKFQMFTVIEELPIHRHPCGNPFRMLLCKCECGIVKKVPLFNIYSGHTKSCGCYQRLRASQINSSHGMSGTPVYNTYMRILSRTENKKDKDYKDYGGRGIKCKWKSFEEFYKDMGDLPGNMYSIDRINVNGNYCKENCRWSTPAVQSRNKRSNIYYKGECSVDASKRLGGSKDLVASRVRKGWTLKKAFTAPLVDFGTEVIAGDIEAIKAKANSLK